MFRNAFIAFIALLFSSAQIPGTLALAQTPETPPPGIRLVSVGTASALADAAGYTLYVLDADTAGTSTCQGTCAQNWPPLAAAAGAQARGPYTVVLRPDGTRQWAYGGKPLYRYKGDTRPGEANGDGFGGKWHVARLGSVTAASAPPEIARTTTSVRGTSYRALDTSTATKTDTPIMQTPLNVQVVTQQVLQDQQVIGIDQAVKNVSAVSVGAGGAANNGQPFSGIYLRGFLTDAHFRDGVRIDSFGGDSNTYGAQLANVESVDVLKGPAAVLYGAVEPGGIVNIVTKQPLSQPYFSIDQQIGSYALARTSLDASGPLSDNGRVLYRVNASYLSDGSFVNYVYNNDVFIAPVLRWSASQNAQLTLEYEYHHLNIGQNFGFLPELNGAPLNTNINLNYGDYSPDIETTNLFALTWAQTFSSQWKLRAKLLSNSTNTDGAGLFPDTITNNVATPSGWGVGRAINNVSNQDFMWTVSADVSKHFAPPGGIAQTLLFGADFVHFGSNGVINQSGFTDTNISYVDLFNPVNPGTPFQGPTTPLLYDSGTNSSVGVYAQDQLAFPGNVLLLAGVRYQGFHQTSNVDFPPAPPSPPPALDASAATPRVGLLWQPRHAFSLYGNFAENFGPNQPDYITASGAVVPPTRGTQWEFGAKGSLLGDRLTVTAAYFDLIKTNIPTPDPNNPNFVVVTGAARSNGLEFDLQGSLSPTWQVVANYANLTAQVTDSNDPNNPVGSPLGGVPHDLAHLWLTHEFGPLGGGLKLGAGATFNGPQPYLYAGTSGLFLPSYSVVDAMAAYTFGSGVSKVRAQVNATNIFNRKYFSDAQNPGFTTTAPYTAITALYGAPFGLTGELVWQL